MGLISRANTPFWRKIFFFFFSFSFFLAKLKMAIGDCKKCGKAIVRAATLTEYKGAKYHSSCFKCTGCGNNITGPEGFINQRTALLPLVLQQRRCREVTEVQ